MNPVVEAVWQCMSVLNTPTVCVFAFTVSVFRFAIVYSVLLSVFSVWVNLNITDSNTKMSFFSSLMEYS